MLTEKRFLEEQIIAQERIRRAMPELKLDSRVLEIADFSLTNQGYEAGTIFTGEKD